ncbi:MAG: L-histidine N(alpha)-methyltransferase [Verrucomicrobiota bacterium]
MNHSPEPIWIHSSRQMEAVTDLRRSCLADGQIPHLFHYEGLRQSQLWRKVARAHAPSSDQAYRDIFREAAKWAGLEPVHVVGLGAGGATKEAKLLSSLNNPLFTPVDVSDSLALLSAQNTRDLTDKPPKPLVADILSFPELPIWLDEFDSGRKRLFTAFGLTPNTAPSELFPALREFLRPSDALLISANQFTTVEDVLSQYENAETLAWLAQVLIDWGIRDNLDEPTFRWGKIDGQTAVIAESRWLRDGEIEWEGEMFHVEQSQVLRLFYSIRYTEDAFREVLAKYQLLPRSLACESDSIWLVER